MKSSPKISPHLLSEKEVAERLHETQGWKLDATLKTIYTEYVLKDFSSAIDLIREIAKIAEKEDHHPDIHLTAYKRLRIELSTHSVGGLTTRDFLLASHINRLPKRLSE